MRSLRKIKRPQYPRLPIMPDLVSQKPMRAVVGDDTPLRRITNLDVRDAVNSIADRAMFEALAKRDDVPGALGVREVKFVITGVDTPAPEIYFINTNTHQLHYYFMQNVLGMTLSRADFNRATYFTNQRRFVAGTIIAHDSFTLPNGAPGLYALEFWPTDPVDVRYVAMAYKLARTRMPFAGDKLAYHPSGGSQEDMLAQQEDEFARQKVNTISTHELFSHIGYSPLNLGTGFGKLRVIDGTNTRPPTITDVVILNYLPNDLPHVAGIISAEPQTPLSHVNLRARQNNTPNAYLRDVAEDPLVASLIGKLIKYIVTPDQILMREAETHEMEGFLAALRPKRLQKPRRELHAKRIVPLDAIGHRDLHAFGAKAANVGELRKILPSDIVPNGFAIPFYFYDAFMRAHGFYDVIREEMKTEEFQQDNEARARVLKKFRKLIKAAVMPADLHDKLGAMQQAFPAGVNPRCRSSANNEDLIGFTGAGLYGSYTQRPDEGHIEKSIKQVWASLWKFEAFEERSFYRIDHFTAAMGVLVHPNFDDELANGVALTKNIYFPNFAGFYINTQVGEALVTNPNGNEAAEELLILEDINVNGEKYEVIRMRQSSLVADGKSLLSPGQLRLLVQQMERIQEHFKYVYGQASNADFAMDIEFKIDMGAQLVIKQARPWIL